MKNKKIIIIFSISIIISLGLIFKSETLYLFDLVKTISKTKRTVADITDYKFFDNIDIPKSENPQAWPLHKDFNNIKDGPVIFFGNEFFDAIPIKQFRIFF